MIMRSHLPWLALGIFWSVWQNMVGTSSAATIVAQISGACNTNSCWSSAPEGTAFYISCIWLCSTMCQTFPYFMASMEGKQLDLDDHHGTFCSLHHGCYNYSFVSATQPADGQNNVQTPLRQVGHGLLSMRSCSIAKRLLPGIGCVLFHICVL